MIRRTRLAPLAFAIVIAIAGLGAPAARAQVPGRTYPVGFSQLVDHPALNATRQGFLDGLKEAGFVEGRNLKFTIVDAQGDAAKTRGISEKLVADKVDLLAPCTTPNVQAAIAAARGTAVPVVFGCVNNPLESGILASLDKPTGRNLSGVYGVAPVERMWDLLVQLHPRAKVIGTIYNPADSNALASNEANKAAAVKRGFTWAEVQVTSPIEVMPAARALAERVDGLLMLQDATVAAAFDAVVLAARDLRRPLFSYDPSAVERGAIAALALDQHQAGLDWARLIAVPVLLGKPAGTIVPVAYQAYALVLNKTAAQSAGIVLAPDLLKGALKVWDE